MSDAIHEVRMPKLGESIAEGTIGEWKKAVGDAIAFDEPLFEVETDKIVTEFPSPEEGVLLDILVPAGQAVPIGAVVARIGPADAVVEAKPVAPAAQTATVAARAYAQPNVEPAAVQPKVSKRARRSSGRLLSPVVRRLATEYHVDLNDIEGSGAGGRIVREDVQAVIAKSPASSPAPQPAAATASVPQALIAPNVAASTADGRQSHVIPLSRIRLITAARMVESRRISAHVWTSVEVDLENIVKLRTQHKERFQRETGASLTCLSFIMRVVCDALHAYPVINASIDTDSKTMTLHPYVHLGVAVDLDEKGLVAPVIRNADSLNVRGLAKALKEIAEAAKQGTLSADNLQGSTFTVTNPGPLGSYASAPIINQPNVAIMATDGVARRPTVVGDGIAIHHMCILGFSYDHRAFDGVTAARFLNHVRASLQEWQWDAEIG